jgi:hypothetical protein
MGRPGGGAGKVERKSPGGGDGTVLEKRVVRGCCRALRLYAEVDMGTEGGEGDRRVVGGNISSLIFKFEFECGEVCLRARTKGQDDSRRSASVWRW